MSTAPFTVAPPGFRLSEHMTLGAVRLQVHDLQRSLDYYTNVIGLRVIAQDGARATLGANGDGVVLVELSERPGATPVPPRGRLGLYHFAILLPDRASLGRFITHLARIGERAGAADHLVSEALYLTDPDGLGIEVYADRPREEWRVENGNLAMATDPLDMQDLVDAAGGAQWDGAPSGTRIGHVHLYVSDLEKSAAFFHHGLGLDRISLAFPGALFMSAGGYHHHLGTNTWAAHAPHTSENDAQLLEWTMHVPDEAHIDAAAESIARAGFVAQRDESGLSTADPWGTRLRIRTSHK